MKQQISLTPSTDVIHVDECTISEGIYTPSNENRGYAGFVIKTGNGYACSYPDGNHDEQFYKSLRDVFDNYNGDFYHIPTGLRIVTEKALGVEDLSINDSIGIIDGRGNKWQVVKCAGDMVNAVCPNHSYLGNAILKPFNGNSVSELVGIPDKNIIIYRFTTAQELHKWLGEDEG